MKAFYNEIDRYCCDWLSNLMDAGHITPGVICDRSIEDLLPNQLGSFDRVHMFAGVGVWDYALNLAGWTTGNVWTGSCPCQPFSAAGKGAGFADERHLWPAWFHLIRECRPGVVFGEQVEAAIAHGWLDLVQDDMEGANYAFGTSGLNSASVGAPNIRARIFFVANTAAERHTAGNGGSRPAHGWQESRPEADRQGSAGVMAHQSGERREQRCSIAGGGYQGINATERAGLVRGGSVRKCCCDNCREWFLRTEIRGPNLCSRCIVDNADLPGSPAWRQASQALGHRDTAVATGRHGVVLGDASSEGLAKRVGDGAIQRGTLVAQERESLERAGNAFWADVEWLQCSDGKVRPTKPGVFPLAYGDSGRMAMVRTTEQTGAEITHWYSRAGALKGIGNAINPEVAAAFIAAYMDCAPATLERAA